MNLIKFALPSSVGKKFLMGLSGLLLVLFVIGHMVGNLQIFLGPETINQYAHFLKSMPKFLWSARVGLLACVAVHILTAISLAADNRKARGAQPYASGSPYKASFASRTMAWSGVIVLSFIVYHLAHFTVGWINGDFLNWKDASGHPDVYRMVVVGFQSVPVSLFYILSMALLCFHLSHGVSALCQSIGLRTDGNRSLVDKLAIGLSSAIFVGNCSIPLSVLTGIIKWPL